MSSHRRQRFCRPTNGRVPCVCCDVYVDVFLTELGRCKESACGMACSESHGEREAEGGGSPHTMARLRQAQQISPA